MVTKRAIKIRNLEGRYQLEGSHQDSRQRTLNQQAAQQGTRSRAEAGDLYALRSLSIECPTSSFCRIADVAASHIYTLTLDVAGRSNDRQFRTSARIRRKP
jgi:hypothetical protein